MTQKVDSCLRRKIVGILRSVRGFYLDNAHLVFAMQEYEGETLPGSSVLAAFVREEEEELQAATDALMSVMRDGRDALLHDSLN